VPCEDGDKVFDEEEFPVAKLPGLQTVSVQA